MVGGKTHMKKGDNWSTSEVSYSFLQNILYEALYVYVQVPVCAC